MMNSFRLLILAGAGLLFSFIAHAEEKEIDETPLTKLEKLTAEVTKNMDENQTKQFGAINNSFSIIRTVEDVQQSITRAVTSCSKANPDIKKSLSGRFEGWKDAVRPVMKQANSKLDKMILMQGFAKPKEVRAYLKSYEAAVIYRNQKIKIAPIEKLEDCLRLQTNMDSTQTNLVNLITETLALNSELKAKE